MVFLMAGSRCSAAQSPRTASRHGQWCAALTFGAIAFACSGVGPGGVDGRAAPDGDGTAIILVGGPGGVNETLRAVPYKLPIRPRGDCPAAVQEWEILLRASDFENLAERTEPELDTDNPVLQTHATLYNSAARLFSATDPATILADLSQVREHEDLLSICGSGGEGYLAQASMFAHAALGDFSAAEEDLSAVTVLVPEAEEELRRQLEAIRIARSEALETASPASPPATPNDSPTPSPPDTSPTP
jgi:hypothetical protein